MVGMIQSSYYRRPSHGKKVINLVNLLIINPKDISQEVVIKSVKEILV
jgi:hypothetical protein